MDQNEYSPAGSIDPSPTTNDFDSTRDVASVSASAESAPAFTDRVREIAGSTQHTLADVGSTVSEKANAMKSSVAAAMESGMDRMKNIDFDSLKASVEKQVREHPGRTLLMAIGVGYLVGRSFKK